ncbi:hypothetical protein G6F56_014674 [Rhizopus delemar]|nr:hypothetical protein G6F56_014674 [Rhizopus delemar]
MPKVNSLPASAALAAWATAAWKAFSLRTTWSEGSTSSRASSFSARTCNAAIAMAGAVLRPIGSRINA